MKEQEPGLIAVCVILITLISMINFVIFLRRKTSIIETTIPLLEISMGCVHQALIAFTAQQTISDYTICGVYLWMPFICSDLIILIKGIQAFKWVLVYISKEWAIMLEAGYGTSSAENAVNSVPLKRRISNGIKAWIHKKYKGTNDYALVKACVIGFFLSMIVPAVINIGVEKYRTDISGLCKDRTPTEQIVIIIELVLFIVFMLPILAFFMLKDDGKPIKRIIFGNAIGWIPLMIFSIAISPKDHKCLYKYFSMIGLFIPFAAETIPMIISSFYTFSFTEKLQISIRDDNGFIFYNILGVRDKEGKPVARNILFQYNAINSFTQDTESNRIYKAIADILIMCMSDLAAIDKSDPERLYVTGIATIYQRYFITTPEDPPVHSGSHNISRFAISLPDVIKNKWIWIVQKSSIANWDYSSFNNYIYQDNDVSKSSMQMVTDTFEETIAYVNNALNVLIDEKFMASGYYETLIKEFIQFTKRRNTETELSVTVL